MPAGRPLENVADYPRPPRLEPFGGLIRIVFAGVRIAETRDSFRILETFHPPTYYLPRTAFMTGVLTEARTRGTRCEWKGTAGYLDVSAGGRTARAAAWTYEAPPPDYAALAGHVAVYAEPMDHVEVAGERVIPQPGNFYGGWVTPQITGPVKGAPGTLHW